MSMSNLGDQLAALSSTNNTKSSTSGVVGFITSTSRNKTQSIGRGFHFSSLHGHSLTTTDDDVKTKVSILYDTAREAASVSLIDLRESAVNALDVLSVAVAEAYSTSSTENENASASPSSLVRMWNSPEFIGQKNGLFSQHNLSYERGMATSQQNKEIDESIQNMLRLIGTMIVEIPPRESVQDGGGNAAAAADDDNGGDHHPMVLLSCLQIIEYLLRRYEIHARPNTAEMLLQTFLPLQVCYPTSYAGSTVFSRIVALVDLQSLPTWTFLRPFAARGAPPLSKGGLVKRVSKDDSLVGVIANIGRVGRDVCLMEADVMRKEMVVDGRLRRQEGRGSGGDASSSCCCIVRRGISTLISFSASILVEALYHQSKSHEGSVKSGGAITTGVQESMVRKILPLILGALKSGVDNNDVDKTQVMYCPEWKEWGRLLASTLAMLSPLNDNVKEALCNNTAEGMPIPSSSMVGGGKKFSLSEVLEKSTSLSVEEVDDATSAIMTLITIMGSAGIVDKKARDDEDDDWDYYLPMLPPSKNRSSNIVDYVGVDIASSTYKILSKNSSSISVAIGAILESIYGDNEDGGDSDHDILDRMVPFVASLVMYAFHRIEKEGRKALMDEDIKKKKKGDEKFKADRDVILLLRLIKEQSLVRLWKFNQSSLIAAVSVRLVNSFNDLHQGSSEKSVSSVLLTERYKSILKALSEINSSVRDQGIAYAINTIPEGKRQKSHLALLLGCDAASLKASKPSPNKDGRVEEADNTVSSLLPLRVALEHADSKIRLDAVVRLNEQIYSEASDGSVDIDAEMGQALLRRLCTEDDPEVAVAAGEILLSQLRVLKGNENEMDEDEPPLLLASLLDDLQSLAKNSLSALLHWTFIGEDAAWSPLSSFDALKKGGKSEQTSIVLESPLTSCIGICGVVAKLIGDEINVENVDAQDGDLDQLTQMYCTLFLAVGAHINGVTTTDNDDSDLTTKVSEAASEELLSFTKDDSVSVSVEEFITSSHIAEYVLEQYYSVNSVDASMPLLQNRFAWLALHAHAELHEKLSTRIDAAYRVVDLIVYQMDSYTKESTKSESFEMEARFLLRNCDHYLPVLKSEDLDGFGKAVLKLLSSSSTVSVDSIAKPAITSQLTSNASKTNVAPDLVLLLHACLRSEASKDGIIRILNTAKAVLEGGKVSNEVAIECIVPAFALLSHHVREVRESLLEMLESIELAEKDEKLSMVYEKVTDKASPLRSSLLMDGVGTLPQALSQIVLSFAQPADMQSFLIKHCKLCALNEDDKIVDGGCQAAAVLLSAMERAGERVFPLARRWELGGRELFQAFLQLNADESDINPSLCRLRDCVATMLKGVLVNTMQVEGDGMSLQISVGPSTSTGRRSRSYSIGASDTFSVLEPYPDSMLNAILEALGSNSSPLMLSQSVLQQAVGRQSWANGVFPKLDSKSKHAVATALLALRTQHENEIAGAALLSLPMTASDLVQLLEGVDVSQSEDSQAAIVFITDCAREKSDLGKLSDITKLSAKLFDQLLALSSTDKNEGDSGGRDYTRVSILQTLLGIHSQYKDQLSVLSADDGKKRRKRSRSHSDVGSTKSLATQANILVGIVGGNPSTFNPLNSGRGRSLALSLLTCLCEESPSTVSSSLLPALMSIAGKHSSSDKGEQARDAVDSRVLADALAAIIPAYCAHAQSADLSLFSLLESFVGKVIVPENGNGKLRTHLIDPFVNALKLLPTKEDSIDAIASLAASVLALQAFNINNEAEATDEEDANSAKLNCHVLATSPSGIKIPISLLLLKYAEQLMSVICGASNFAADETSLNLKAGVSEVASLALRGSSSDGIPSSYAECNESQQRSILYLAICLLEMVRDVTGTNAVKRLLRKSQGDDADVSLRLWQELLQAHMSALRAHAKLAEDGKLRGKERKFWTAVPVAISECLENIQGLLPVPHFLASVSSTLADESTDTYMRKKTVRLLADRVAEVSLDSPEASLFLEMVPELVAQVGVATPRVKSEDEEAVAAIKRNIIIQQGALVALESFVRSLCPASDKSKLTSKAADAFLPALESVTKLFSSTAASWSKESDEDDVEMLGIKDAECQLLSSSALCLSSLVAVLKARCLPFLPSIVKPLISSLKYINLLVKGTDVHAESSESMLQLAILRLLETLAEHLPQFLPPYLPLIFSKNALPSRALRRGDYSLKEATERVESALASKTPIRQLTPALSKALSNTLVNDDGTSDWEEACSILGVINASVGSSERSELPPVIGKIFNVLVAAYAYEVGADCKSRLLEDANKVLLSLVMKLSESQLRQLYARLREWRGEIKENDNDAKIQSCSRRVAFWGLSAALSKSLRSIFLPCLTSVLTDVVDELEIAVSLLCQRPKHDGQKRRRVDEDSDDDSSVDDSEVSPLQPLLLCLESALKADAHEGGDWTRGDDNQRYNMILSHLGKLLMAHVPKDLPLSSDLSQKEDVVTSTYQKLVEGQGTLEHGNVVGCLTALATAAGNEQLWKPLNFAVLEACSHKRSEVRRAGISCLLSIIETVGEEYMVLLPECLPVLSELLEDGDEEIAGMAKECVRQGEELLGESLEDSLR